MVERTFRKRQRSKSYIRQKAEQAGNSWHAVVDASQESDISRNGKKIESTFGAWLEVSQERACLCPSVRPNFQNGYSAG